MGPFGFLRPSGACARSPRVCLVSLGVRGFLDFAWGLRGRVWCLLVSWDPSGLVWGLLEQSVITLRVPFLGRLAAPKTAPRNPVLLQTRHPANVDPLFGTFPKSEAFLQTENHLKSKEIQPNAPKGTSAQPRKCLCFQRFPGKMLAFITQTRYSIVFSHLCHV